MTTMKIRIKDFQSIEDIDLEVSGLTCLVGPSDIGKSSIIRALEGTFTNPPVKGDVRNGKEGLEVNLDLPGLPKITWTKLAKGSGTYTVGDTYYEKLGRDVPPEFEDLGLLPVQLDSGAEIYTYVQGQHDSPFLDDQPKLLAEIISKFGSLSSISKAHVLINRDIKADKKNIRLLAEKKNDLDHELKTLEWVPEVRGRFDKIVANIKILEEKQQEVEEVKENLKELKELLAKKKVLESLEERLQKIPDTKPIKKLSELAQEASHLINSLNFEKKTEEKLDKLLPVLKVDEAFIEILAGVEDEIRESESIAGDIRLFKAIIEEEDINSRMLEALTPVKDIQVDDLMDLWGTIKDIDRLIDSLEHQEGAQNTLDEELESLQGKISEVQKELEKVDICPLCGSSPENLSENTDTH